MKFTKKKAGMQEERIAGNEPVHIKAGASIPEGDMKGGINDPNTSFITGLEIENPGRGDIVQRAPYADMYCSVNGSDPVPVNSDIDCGRIRVNKDGTFEFGVGGLLPYNRPKTVKVLQVNPNPVPTAYSFTARLGDFTKVDGTVNISTQITTDDLKRLWNFTNNGLVEEIRQPNDFKIYTLTAKGLSDLIRDISLITKIEEAPEQLHKEKVFPKNTVDEVSDELRAGLDEKGILVENMLPPDLYVTGNPSLIYAVFRNLMENSLKYGGREIKIHIECYAKGDGYCHFSYYDTGKGVADEHLPKIFERFYRVSEGRTRDDGGSGLGLSIVRNAIAFHKGDIRALNRKGGGLEFLFSLSVK